MKNIITILFAGFLMITANANASHLSARMMMSAKLTGSQEVPSVVTDALGVASFTLNSTRDTLCLHANVNGLSGLITGAHIHEGAIGVSGGVIIDLTDDILGNSINAMLTGSDITSEIISKMLSGNYYINVHTAANPDGEIRGQITLETDFAYTAVMDGSQESPAVVTSAYGLGSFDLYKNLDAISFRVVVQGLSGVITGAHLHIGASGVSGPVIEDLTTMVTGNVIEGEIDPAAYLLDLLGGNIYINVHTSANPNGEIRGQLTTDSRISFDAFIDGAQEVPAVVTDAKAVGTMKLNTTLDTLRYHIVADGLSGDITGSHFHTGKFGESGPVIIDASDNISGNQITGMVTGSELTPELINNFLTGGIYFNIHTAANPNGEIRGQVYRFAREGLSFTMDGNQETPPTTATGTGAGLVTIDRFQENAHVMVVLSGLTGPITGAHFHNNVAGESGGVIYDLGDWFTKTGTDDAAFGYWTDEDATTPFSKTYSSMFLNDSVYINVHTTANPNGEIRGQVVRGADCFNTSVGIADVSYLINGSQLYPNPVFDQLTVHFEALITSNAKIEIVDLNGRTVFINSVILQKGVNDMHLGVGSLSNGVYFVRVLSSNESAVIGKFIKQ